MSNYKFPTRTEWGQNGFPDRSEVNITWSDSGPDRTLTLTPSGTSFRIIQHGVVRTKYVAETIQISDVEGVHWIYYNNGVLNEAVNPTDDTEEDLITEYCLVAAILWNADQSEGQQLIEAHGSEFMTFVHKWAHETMGMRYGNGLVLGDMDTDGNGDDKSAALFSMTSGEVYDEDIEHKVPAIATSAELQIWFRRGANWRYKKNGAFRSLTHIADNNRMVYDNSGTLAEVGNGNFALMHAYAWNKVNASPIMIVGQNEYPTAGKAREGATTEINALDVANLPFNELKPLYSFICQTSNGYDNGAKMRIRTTDTGADAVDWRRQNRSSGGESANLGDYVTKNSLASYLNTQNATITNATINTLVVTGTAVGVGGYVENTNIMNPDYTATRFTTDNTWNELDCSDKVPDGAQAIDFRLVLSNGSAGQQFHFRKKGSFVPTLGQKTQVADVSIEAHGIVHCNASRIVEYRGSNTTFTTINVYVKGWKNGIRGDD